MRGDLDWIVMKCLEKDRARRYETASALARDLEFHLEHKPVLAAAPTVGYRLSKFVRRHQAIMLRSAAAFLIGVVAVTGVLWILNGRGPRWLPEIRPRPRVVNTPPHIDFEQGISDVYVQDHRVTAPGVRLLACERYVFIRVKAGPGGWRAFDALTHDLVKTHTQSVAYVMAPGGRRAFELALDAHGLVCQLFPQGQPVRVAPAAAATGGTGDAHCRASGRAGHDRLCAASRGTALRL